MHTLTHRDISHDEQEIDLGGLTATIRTAQDDCTDAPWERADGHGPVSEWTTRAKAAGERVLCSDGRSKRYYDYAEAIRIAKRDGWDAPPYQTGTKGEQAVRAVEADFKFLSDWANDRWTYIGVIVSVCANGVEIGRDSIWGVEDCETDDGQGGRRAYWKELAAEMVNDIVDTYRKAQAAQAEYNARESAERAEWEARDTVTVG